MKILAIALVFVSRLLLFVASLQLFFLHDISNDTVAQKTIGIMLGREEAQSSQNTKQAESSTPGKILITEVYPQSAAAQAGLLSGDIITTVNSLDVGFTRDFVYLIEALRGQEITQKFSVTMNSIPLG